MTTLLVRDLAQVVSPAGREAPLRGPALRELDIVEDGYVLCRDGTITDVGPMRSLGALDPREDVVEIDGRNRAALPGLVDCHTHACFSGDRAAEFELRSAGATYEELHAAGGGILSTVRATRAAGEEELRRVVECHRARMLRHGTTTFEAKSGYGLDRETELAQLRAVAAAGGIPTWLGAHAVPPEVSSADAYLDFALGEVLPEAAALAEAADVFLERGAFDATQARRYLTACAEHGLALRLHADQFTESGGIPLALELGARSVDHLEATGEAGVQALAEVLPEAAALAEAADVFLERGAFDATQARRYLAACGEHGLALRLHADQFTEAGGIPLALELGARSVDHLEATGEAGVQALAEGEVTAVLLPVAALFLGRPMPRARALVDAGAPVALATDFNPGSAFCESLAIVASLACTQLGLVPAEALAAITVNAAHVVRRADRVGRIAPGFAADLVLLEADDWRYLAYHLGGEDVALVVKDGHVAWERDGAAA